MRSPERIAILEDNQEIARNLVQKFSERNITGTIFSTRQEFKQSIERGDKYDLVVLDWIFEETDTSIQAQLVLQDMRRMHYAPVVIYTEEPGAARAEIEGLERPFNRTPSFSKSELTAEALADRVSKWYEESFNARLSVVWRPVRSAAFEQSLWELETLESADFHRTLQRLLTIGSGELVDVDHALEFLERYVARKVLSDAKLRETVNEELLKERLPQPKTKQERLEAQRREPALVNAHSYTMPSDQVSRTGDVVELQHVGGTLIAVVLTPACDLENAKCRELRLGEAEATNRAPERDSEWQLPPMKMTQDGPFSTPLLNFHKTLYVTDVTVGDVKGRMISYNDEFQDRFGTKIRLRRICRLDDPYRSDLLQKYSSHASRVGTP